MRYRTYGMHKHVTSCSDVYKTLREELLSLTLKEILYKPTKRKGLMKFKQFVELYCEKGTTENEHRLYWYFYQLGRSENNG